jgi:hypothetical protein
VVSVVLLDYGLDHDQSDAGTIILTGLVEEPVISNCSAPDPSSATSMTSACRP